MYCFTYFVCLFSENNSPSQWLDAMLKGHGGDFLILRFEGGGLLSQPTLRDLTGPFGVKSTLQWMDLLLAALDCYNTFIGLHIIRPEHMLSKQRDTSMFLALPLLIMIFAAN